MVSISIGPSTKFNVHVVECFSWALWVGIICYVIGFREFHKQIKHDKILIFDLIGLLYIYGHDNSIIMG
jgi:hypothetical protein